ncbi:SAM-dependent methyltransferase [Nocardia farcinica]|nr:SAM-dependent methyltransferase [Nocardia farcinica]
MDLEAGHKLITHSRAFLVAARATRLWLLRAVRYLASEQLVRQFVELGSGYPCSPRAMIRTCGSREGAPSRKMIDEVTGF